MTKYTSDMGLIAASPSASSGLICAAVTAPYAAMTPPVRE